MHNRPIGARQQRGFTLIELVVVIAILGILAAFVLPRLADLTEQAHTANVQATRGAFTSAVNLVQATWISQGKQQNVTNPPGGYTNLPNFGTGDMDVTLDGWPADRAGNSTTTAMTATKCIEVWQGLLINQAPTAGVGLNFGYGVTASGTLCTYTYQGGGTGTRTITYDASSGDVGGTDS